MAAAEPKAEADPTYAVPYANYGYQYAPVAYAGAYAAASPYAAYAAPYAGAAYASPYGYPYGSATYATIAKRDAEAEPKAEAEADPAYLYGAYNAYPYANYGYNYAPVAYSGAYAAPYAGAYTAPYGYPYAAATYHTIAKREAEPEAEPQYYGGYGGRPAYSPYRRFGYVNSYYRPAGLYRPYRYFF